MKITGVVAEYNPFHEGHKYHLERARQESACDCLAVVMSGNYVQRGEPAIIDKFRRGEAAIYGGADLVIELPMPFSCQNAEMFSYTAIKELTKLNVDSISFGCESDDIQLLQKIAYTQLTPDFNKNIKKELKKGLSYPNALSNSLISILGNEAKVASSPNNILAIEYIKSAIKLNLDLKYYPVKRVGTGHKDTELLGDFHSASAIRKSLIEGQSSKLKLTDKSREMIESFYIEHKKFNSLNNYLDFLYYKIISKDDLNDIFEIKEGLDNKILSQVYRHENLDDFIKSLKSKRYTYSKLRRTLLNILLDINKSDIAKFTSPNTAYVKMLAFNNRGRRAINYIRGQGTILVNRYSDYRKYGLNPEKLKTFKLTDRSTNLYYLLLENRKYRSEYTDNAVYVDI